MIKIETTCPLGSKCEEVKNDTVYRCRWYTQIQGMNPQTGEQMDTWDCAIAWLPILSVEMSRTNRGQTAALESFRNEMVNATEVSQQILSKSISITQEITEGRKVLEINPTGIINGDIQ